MTFSSTVRRGMIVWDTWIIFWASCKNIPFMPKHPDASLGWQRFFILGHMISAQGVQVHQEKIQAIVSWPTPKTLIELQGFLGLYNYYWWFVKGFSWLSASLDRFDKKGAFRWAEVANKTFNKLKEIMSLCPVLGLLDFGQPFILESDAFREGIRAVLMQKGRPIAFESLKLEDTKRLYSPYMTKKCWPSCTHWQSLDNIWWVIGS